MKEAAPLRVLFLTLYPETMPSSRLRVFQYVPYLKRAGIDVTILPSFSEPWFSRFYFSSSKWVHLIQYSTEILRNLTRLYRARRYDVVFIQKGILSTNLRGFDRLLDWANDSLIFDFDDLIYGRSLIEFQWPPLRMLQDLQQAQKISSQCSAVIAGNRYLQRLALQYNPNVFLIPTPVDTNRFRPLPFKAEAKKKRKEIVIGWIGVESTLGYVRSLEKVLQKLSGRYPLHLKLITRLGQPPFRFDGLPIEFIPWSYQSEVEEMADFDIGIMPLPNDLWARGKCGLKLLQYMAMGLPSVSSDTEANRDIVEEGRDGFLAGTTEEWITKLSRLIEDPHKREEMGIAAREKAIEKYSLEKNAPSLVEVLNRVAQKKSHDSV